MMKKVSYFIISVLLLSCKSNQHNDSIDKKYTFQIILGSCFEKDKISIYIDDELSLISDSIESNPILGVTENSITYYDSKKELIIFDGKEKTKNFVAYNTINLKVIKNGISEDFELDIKKGKNIMIDACEFIHENKVTIKQSKKQFVLE